MIGFETVVNRGVVAVRIVLRKEVIHVAMEAPELVTVTWPEHTKVLLDGIWNAFVDRYKVDVEVTCNGHSRPVAAHQVILGIFCPILKRHLDHDATDKVDKVGGYVSLDYDLSGSDFDLLLEFVYRGQVKVPRDKLDGLEKVALALGVHGLVGAIDKLRDDGDREHPEAVSARSSEWHLTEKRGAKKRKGIPVKLQKNGRRSSNEEVAAVDVASDDSGVKPLVAEALRMERKPPDEDGDDQPVFLGTPKSRHAMDPNGRHPLPGGTLSTFGIKHGLIESDFKSKSTVGGLETHKRTLWFRDRGRSPVRRPPLQYQSLGRDLKVDVNRRHMDNDEVHKDQTTLNLCCSSNDVVTPPASNCVDNPPETGHSLDWTMCSTGKRTANVPLPMDVSTLDDQPQRGHDLALHLQQQQFLAHYHQVSAAAAATVTSVTLPDKPHKCPECSYTADLKSVVNRHVRSKHRNERPYGCETCGFRSKTRSAYNMHVRSHNEVKPFNCHICGQGYTRRINLKAHMQKHSSAC